MKELAEYKNQIHSCSKCGLCQSVCPIYKITGNDCSVSRGHFIMLRGLLKGELKMSPKINRYLDLCLKCGACTKFCPSGNDVVDVIASAKAEYFNSHPFEKIISFVQKNFIFGLGVTFLKIFSKNQKSKKFDKKVVYFGGCSGKLKGNRAVVKILNACGVEVLTPDFDCCGIPFYVRGDKRTYEECAKKYLKKLDGVMDVVTTCASCEKTIKHFSSEIKVRNIFEYMRANGLKLKLKKNKKVTFHKPCNIDNFDDIRWILDNTENLEYVKMEDFDKCCGLNGITKLNEYSIMSKLFFDKHNKILKSGAKTVLTSCFGCEIALKMFSFGKYSVEDFTEFLAKNS